MIKNISIGLVLIVGVVAGILIFQHSKSVVVENAPLTPAPVDQAADDTSPTLSQKLPGLNQAPDAKEKAWMTLQKYLGFAEKHDLKNLRTVAYQISPACNDPAQEKTCFERMDTAYYFGSQFKKDDFKYVWSDEKQIILATEFNVEENETMLGRNRAMIYFVVVAGEPKVLYFNPAKGSLVTKGKASQQELSDRLVIYTEDKDMDGKEDYLEQCLSVSQDKSCIKTDPKIRDTDQDGFWDGIEALFY